jgi:hypothetical protein
MYEWIVLIRNSAAPEYATLENGHYKVNTSEKTTLAISLNSDTIGVLKAHRN